MPSTAVIVIGNELLTGKFTDENGAHLVRRLRELGGDLVRLVFIPDEIDVIADEVARCAALADHVVTSGGVGPTHDDLTLAGVAAAFDLPLVEEPGLVRLIDAFGMERTPATLRMATLPEGTELIACDMSSYPVLRCRNVWILPGIPKLFRSKFESIAHHFAGSEIFTARLYIDAHETDFADILTKVVAGFTEVDVGSYPRWGEAHYKVVLTLESRDEHALNAAREALSAALPVVPPPPS